MPRLTVTRVAFRLPPSLTFGERGTRTRIVALARILVVPLPIPSSLPSPKKRGSFGCVLYRCCASSGETVPVFLLWHVRQVRPLPPNVSDSKRCLPWLTAFSCPNAD